MYATRNCLLVNRVSWQAAWRDELFAQQFADCFQIVNPIAHRLDDHEYGYGKQQPPITELKLRRGTIGDIKGMKISSEVPLSDLISIASRLSGQPTGVIERLDAEDSGEVMSIALGFYARALVGGSKRSRP